MDAMKCNKDGWVKKKLGEVCEKTLNIQWPNAATNDEYPYIDLTAVNRETNTIKGTEIISKENAPSRAKQIVKFNDIIFATTRPSLKRVCIIPAEYNGSICSTGFCVIRTKELVLPSWMFYNLKSDSFYDYLKPLEKGVTYPAVSNSEVLNYRLTIPPLPEQQRIVSELDCLNGIIEKQKEQLKQLDELAQSIFYDMFGDPVENEKGWPIAKLKKVSSLITNGNTPKGGDKNYVKDGILFLRSQNVWRNELKLEDAVYIDESTNASMKNSILQYNDILITKTGRINTDNSSLGRASLFTGLDNTANINGHVYLVRLSSVINPIYYLYALISDSFRILIRKVCVGGIDKRQLNKNHIEDFPVMLAPLPLQQSFASKIEAIEHQKELIKKSIAETETLFTSRMDYYFG